SPAALCVAPTGLGSNLALSQRLRAGLISAAPDGAGLWMLRAVQLPQLGLAYQAAGFHRGAGLSSGLAFIAGLASQAVWLSSWGWLFQRPGFHRGAGFSSGPAFIVGLAFRAARLSSSGWLFERPGFHCRAGFSKHAEFMGCLPICSVAKRDRISTVLFLQRIIVESHSQRILTP